MTLTLIYQFPEIFTKINVSIKDKNNNTNIYKDK